MKQTLQVKTTCIINNTCILYINIYKSYVHNMDNTTGRCSTFLTFTPNKLPTSNKCINDFMIISFKLQNYLQNYTGEDNVTWFNQIFVILWITNLVWQIHSMSQCKRQKQCVTAHLTDLNTLKPRQNGRHFANNIFKGIFLNENLEFFIKFHWNIFLGV